MYHSNINLAVGKLSDKLKSLQQNPDEMLRTVALTVLPEVKKRVHVEGKDANNARIGTYSESYMKVRTGGNVKGSKPNKSGSHPKYNRTNDTTVVLSLTRQMENDFSVLPSPTGYGLGYNNSFNYKKSQWVQGIYKGKAIWQLSDKELALAFEVAEAYVDELLKN